MLIKNRLFKSVMVNASTQQKHYMASKRVTCPWMNVELEMYFIWKQWNNSMYNLASFIYYVKDSSVHWNYLEEHSPTLPS